MIILWPVILTKTGMCVCMCVYMCKCQGGGKPQTDFRCRRMCVCVRGPPSCLDLGRKQAEEKKAGDEFTSLVNSVIKMPDTHAHGNYSADSCAINLLFIPLKNFYMNSYGPQPHQKLFLHSGWSPETMLCVYINT